MDEDDPEVRAVRHAAHGLQLRAAEKAGHDQRIQTAEQELAEWQKARREADEYRTTTEQAEDERLRVYFTLKARDALDVYYLLYPDHRPESEKARVREDGGRER